jgi:cysteine desulfurase/selenocysteine lyase
MLSGIKKDFPWFASVRGAKCVYLDSAATTHKPQTVLDTILSLYAICNSSVNRSEHAIAESLSEMYLEAHRKIASFIAADGYDEIIFTKNCTDSINMVASSILRAQDHSLMIRAGDRIIVTVLEHHSNLVPWQELARATGAELVMAESTENGLIDIANFKDLINDRTRIAAFTHASNVLGTINPVRDICSICRDNGILSLVDGSQAAPHFPIDVLEIGCDFYAFSAHKMLGPTGIGVLYGRRDILNKMSPTNFGGGMIAEVFRDRASWTGLPWKFEAGTPDAVGAIAFAGATDPATNIRFPGAVDYLINIGPDRIREHELRMLEYAAERLREFDGLRIMPGDMKKNAGIISFAIERNGSEIDCHTVARMLADEGASIRSGGHCAYPLIKKLDTEGTVRISMYIYNELEDIDFFSEKLKKVLKNIL